MQVGYHLFGGAGIHKKMKIAASFANAGIPSLAVTNAVGINPCSTTSALPTYGLALDTGTYSATQGDAEGLVTVDIRPDTVIRALCSGGGTEGTALTTHTNSAAETAGTTVTASTIPSNDMAGGIAWCITGANVGQSRTITTHTGSTSFVVTVPFLNDIAANDVFLMVPYNAVGVDDSTSGVDAGSAVTTSTLFTQADASAAAGSGIQAAVVDLELNGTTDTYVLFTLPYHVYGTLQGHFSA